MAYNPNYDKRIDAGSSGGEITDLTPERAYDVDLRRLSEDQRETAYAAGTRNERQQSRVASSLKAAKAAGKYRQSRGIAEPWTDRSGQTPAFIEGDRFGRAGSTNYADKPQASTSKLYY
jgi:hypothetical protein